MRSTPARLRSFSWDRTRLNNSGSRPRAGRRPPSNAWLRWGLLFPPRRRFLAYGLQLIELALDHAVGVLLGREGARAHVLDVGFEDFPHLVPEVGVLLHELGCEGLEDAQDVRDDHDLTVALRPGADAVDRDRQLLGDHGRDLGRDGLDQHR